MTGIEMSLALPWIVFAVTWVAIGLVAIAIARAARPLLARIDAEQRATLLLAIALLPLCAAALVAVLGFSPRIGGLLVDRHCHPDVGCVAHVPILHTTAVHAALLASTLLVATASLIWSIGGRLRRSVALARTLAALAERGEHGLEIVESPKRFAYCVGLLKPRVLVSRGVLALPATQREAVLAHEYAHASRRDNLRRWLAGVSLWPVPKRSLLADLSDANEESCDLAASAACGQRSVEDALATLALMAPAAEASGYGALGAAARLRALECPPSAALPMPLLGAAIVVAYAACVLGALDAAHHGTELVLGWLG